MWNFLTRLSRRWRDYQRERRIEAYHRLSERAFRRGKERHGVKFARLMAIEVSARSDEQLARMELHREMDIARRTLNELREARRARRG
jgi:hypothetical protein